MTLPFELPSPALVILCGPAACGKTTWARAHFSPTQVVSSDHCRALIADDEGNQDVSAAAFEIFHAILDQRLRYRRLTVADSTALSSDARADLRRIARRRKVPAVCVAFPVPIEELLGRNAARERKVPDETVREQHALFVEKVMPTLPLEGYAAVQVQE